MLKKAASRVLSTVPTRHHAATSTLRSFVRHHSGRPSQGRQLSNPILMSSQMMKHAMRNVMEDIDLLVCDMAGTTVQEGGVVYETLHRVMVEDGLDVSSEDMGPWHGAKKEQVMEHFARRCLPDATEAELEARIYRMSEVFISQIEQSYFGPGSNVALIDDGLLGYFKQLQRAGIKVALDTGYPPELQDGLVNHLGFKGSIDGYISSYDVSQGRPYPYMIHQLMERFGIDNVRRVAKVGDSVRDIEMGRNAGCGLVVGVLSGADSEEELMAAGADIVAAKVTELPVPLRRRKEGGLKLPDLS